jgi:hypothetical protein
VTPEGKVKAEIKKWLKEQGAYFFMPVQTGYGASTLDFLVCYKGIFVGIEAKAPGKVPTKRQEFCMAEIRDAGGHATCVESLRDLIPWIQERWL